MDIFKSMQKFFSTKYKEGDYHYKFDPLYVTLNCTNNYYSDWETIIAPNCTTDADCDLCGYERAVTG